MSVPDKNDKSLASLLSDLSRETVDLIQKEIALAKAEMSQKVSTAQTAAISMAAGGAVAFAGAILLLIGIANLVAMILPPDIAPWLAPLLVGGIVAAIGYGMIKGGKSKLDADSLTPHRTIESLQRDKAVLQEKTR